MIIFFVVLISVTASEAAFCSSPDENTLYVYPSAKNCSVFIACIDFEEYEFDCLLAPIFLPWAKQELCMEPCEVVSTTKKISTKTVSELPPDPLLFPDSPSRTIVCPPSGETKAVKSQSCTEYISCSDGIGTQQTCPADQEFSPSKYECVPKKNSDCQKHKQKGSHHSKCRYDNGGAPIYFTSDSCPEFKKCANKLAWEVKCARYCHWNNDKRTCDWADSFNCHLTNHE